MTKVMHECNQCFVVRALALDMVRWEGEASGQKSGVSINSYRTLRCVLWKLKMTCR